MHQMSNHCQLLLFFFCLCNVICPDSFVSAATFCDPLEMKLASHCHLLLPHTEKKKYKLPAKKIQTSSFFLYLFLLTEKLCYKYQMATLDQQQQQHAHPKSHLNLVKDMHPMSRNIDCEVLVLQKGIFFFKKKWFVCHTNLHYNVFSRW